MIACVTKAIVHLKDHDGSSSVSIKNYFADQPATILEKKTYLPFIVAALHCGTNTGVFISTGGRKWKLAPPPAAGLVIPAAAPMGPTPLVVNLKMLQTSTGKTKLFRVRRTLKLRKIFKAYSQEASIPFQKLKFLKDGHRLISGSVESAGLQDYDEIDVFVDSSPRKVSSFALNR